MPYPVIPNDLRNIESIHLGVMSPEEMLKMSYGEVINSETINYRSGDPIANGLFCQAIFGPVKDWECHCGKYKRYRYAGVICDRCGVEVASSSVRRERMGHISLACPCVHPWFSRVIPSRIATLLDIKTIDLHKVTYFSMYIITEINEGLRQDFLNRIDYEAKSKINQIKQEYESKLEVISSGYMRSKSSGQYDINELKAKFEAEKEFIKNDRDSMVIKIETVAEIAKKELSSLQVKMVISESTHRDMSQKFGPAFKAGIGPESIQHLLKNIDLQTELEKTKEEMQRSKGQSRKKLAKKMRLIKTFIETNTRPEWMVLERIMVLPPDLRPMLQLDGGRFATSDLNELYKRVINRNNRLRKLIQIGAPDVIVRNEKRMLQEAVEALIDNSARNGKQVMASTGAKRALKSLTDSLKGKGGRFRQNLLGKRVDYSGRSVIIVGPNLKIDECGLPKIMAMELFKPFLIGRIISKSEAGLLPEEYQCFNVHSARRLIETDNSVIYDILAEVIQNKYVLLNRAPTLHRLGFLAFKPILIEGKAIQLHPMVCKGFNADFDGDQMAVHVPISTKGQKEAKELMTPQHNLLKPANGKITTAGNMDLNLGLYYLTRISKNPDKKKAFATPGEAKMAHENGIIEISEVIRVKVEKADPRKSIETTLGRIILNEILPDDVPYFNDVMDKKKYETMLNQLFHIIGENRLGDMLDDFKNLGFKYATSSGVTMSCGDLVVPKEKYEVIENVREKAVSLQDLQDLGLLSSVEKYKQTVNLWKSATVNISKIVEKNIDPEVDPNMIILSGARGNVPQLTFMVGMRGLSMDASGKFIELPAKHSYVEGLNQLEFFITLKATRKGQADTALKTADAGYLTRRLVDVAQNMVIMAENCGTKEGVLITKENSKAQGRSVLDRIYGRYLCKDLVLDGEVILSAGSFIDYATFNRLKEISDKLDNVKVRAVTKCELPRGVCKHCYGIDFATQKPVKMGTPVGIIAAQSIGEQATQLTVSSIKTFAGTAASNDIVTGLPRVEEIFEARIPKYIAPMSVVDGTVAKIEGNLEQGYKVTIQAEPASQILKLEEGDTLLVEENKTVSQMDPIIASNTGELKTALYSGKITVINNQVHVQIISPVLEYTTLPGIYISVKEGQKVHKGDMIAQGPQDLQSLMDFMGIDKVEEYIKQELAKIYIENGIDVDSKHIEVIIKQICSRVQVIDSGQSELATSDTLKYTSILSINKKLVDQGLKPASFRRIVTGISKASLTTDSFLSAASFQETARVLVEAAISGKRDRLWGLKENVILGQLVPCGTGFNEEKTKAIFEEVEYEYYSEEGESA